MVVCNAADTRAISHARVKSDRFDAAMLARLLAAGMLKRGVGGRRGARSRCAGVSRDARHWCAPHPAKNEVHAS